MEMHQIRYFLAVAELLNFTRAAEACNVTQPALTRAIQKLEEELGGLVFRRERGLTHLTDLGHLVKPRLESIYKESSAAKKAAKDFLKLDQASFRLGVMCTIGPLRIIPFLSDFNQKHPGIEVTLIEGAAGMLLERMYKGEIDVAALAMPHGFDDRCNVQPLYSERFALAMPQGHPLSEHPTVSFKDVEGLTYLSRINCEFTPLLDEICAKEGVDVKTVYRSEREDWILTMVTAGLGVCMLPEFSATIPGMVLRPLVNPPVTRQVSLVTLSGRRFSPAVKAFIQAAKTYKWPKASLPL